MAFYHLHGAVFHHFAKLAAAKIGHGSKRAGQFE
jgi:hypothetical protein